jgi:hypothetical protein
LIGTLLRDELNSGTRLMGSWPIGIWLSELRAEVIAEVDVAPVPVFVKAASSKVANCAAVGLVEDSIEARVLPDEAMFDSPRSDRSVPSVVDTPEFVRDDVVLDVVPTDPAESDRELVPWADVKTVRFRNPLVSAPSTGVKVIVVIGVFETVPIPELVVPVCPVAPVVKVGIVPAEVIGTISIATGIVPADGKVVSDPLVPFEDTWTAVPLRPLLTATAAMARPRWWRPVWRRTDAAWVPLAFA